MQDGKCSYHLTGLIVGSVVQISGSIDWGGGAVQKEVGFMEETVYL